MRGKSPAIVHLLQPVFATVRSEVFQMSQTFSLVCHETKKRIWIGQGWGKMDVFYSGEPNTLAALGSFLREHQDKPLVLVCDDKHEEIWDYLDVLEDRPIGHPPTHAKAPPGGV